MTQWCNTWQALSTFPFGSSLLPCVGMKDMSFRRPDRAETTVLIPLHQHKKEYLEIKAFTFIAIHLLSIIHV